MTSFEEFHPLALEAHGRFRDKTTGMERLFVLQAQEVSPFLITKRDQKQNSFILWIFPSTKICSQNTACSVIQTCCVAISYHSSAVAQSYTTLTRRRISYAKYRGLIGFTVGQKQVELTLKLTMVRTSEQIWCR